MVSMKGEILWFLKIKIRMRDKKVKNAVANLIGI